jgi:hypothetical protein
MARVEIRKARAVSMATPVKQTSPELRLHLFAVGLAESSAEGS